MKGNMGYGITFHDFTEENISYTLGAKIHIPSLSHPNRNTATQKLPELNQTSGKIHQFANSPLYNTLTIELIFQLEIYILDLHIGGTFCQSSRFLAFMV